MTHYVEDQSIPSHASQNSQPTVPTAILGEGSNAHEHVFCPLGVTCWETGEARYVHGIDLFLGDFGLDPSNDGQS